MLAAAPPEGLDAGARRRLLELFRDGPDLERLRAGDERAYRELVDEYGPVLFRLARGHTPDRAVAEEVVQETWLAVLRGIDGFAGRSSLRTWMCSILLRIAARRSGVEARSVPMDGPTVDPGRFLDSGPYAGHWRSFPDDWSGVPESALLGAEVRDVALAALDQLPPAQRTAVTLRDLEGWSPQEVGDLLGVTDGNQRVLLHRGRAGVRQALEDYLGRTV